MKTTNLECLGHEVVNVFQVRSRGVTDFEDVRLVIGTGVKEFVVRDRALDVNESRLRVQVDRPPSVNNKPVFGDLNPDCLPGAAICVNIRYLQISFV